MNDSRDLFAKCREFTLIDDLKSQGLYPFFRPIQATIGSSVVSHGKKRVMIGSNNYLGLTHDLRVQEAAKKAIEQFGTGCTGSRFLNGNLELHEELESELAQFLGFDSCLVFSTGFFANQGALSSLVGRGDVIYFDRENHASLVEGQRLALGKTLKFRHNDMEDLERILKKTRDEFEGALIVADGVFSMSGEIVNYPKIVELARKYDCRIFIDDAHALGVLGEKGEGTSAFFESPFRPDIVMGTFSKSFASIGGFIASDHKTINFIKHKARPFMFSAAMPPGSVAGVLECLRIVQKEDIHLKNLWKNARFMHRELKRIGFNTMHSKTPIIPLLIGEDEKAFAFTQALYENGIFATPVVKPAVPDGFALVRTSYMASHTEEELLYALDVLAQLGEKFGVISDDNKNSNEDWIEDLGPILKKTASSSSSIRNSSSTSASLEISAH